MSDLATQARSLAAQALAVEPAVVVSCEPIKHGLTNESWLVRTSDDAVVVRISNTAEDALQIDRFSEAAVLRAVDVAGIGAPVLMCDPRSRILVTRYVGEHWPAAVVHVPAKIARVGELLQRLHRVPPPAQTRRLELSQSVSGYFQTLDELGVTLDLTKPALRLRALHAANTLQAKVPAVLCHNDVHHLNLIDVAQSVTHPSHSDAVRGQSGATGHASRDQGAFSGAHVRPCANSASAAERRTGFSRLYLIDWEYAGLGPPAFDLASICVYERFTPEQRRQLLEHYAGPAAGQWGDSLELACWLFDYVRDLWMAVREGGGA